MCAPPDIHTWTVRNGMYQAHRYPGVETEQDGNKSTKPHMSICCGDMDEVMDTGQVFYRPAACPAFVIFFFLQQSRLQLNPQFFSASLSLRL